MNKHKDQSKEGDLSVHFSIACVAYNLYDNLKINYYDPPNPNVEYNKELNNKLSRLYYDNILNSISNLFKDTGEMYLDEYHTYKLNDILKSNKKFELLIYKYIIKKYKENLVFLDNIKQEENDENLYIDLDGIEFRIGQSNE
jgi:hypothetical protein